MSAEPVAHPTEPDGEARAWGWAAHLREGGTTPWRDWRGTAPAAGRVVPGAQQLELLRRLNLASSALAAPVATEARTRLADRVLTAAAAGRGRADLPLVGAGSSPYGPRPVDPADLRPHDLVRVASVLLAEDLVALGPDPLRTRAARPWRRRVRLVGDPLVGAVLREDLLTRGRPEGGPLPFVVVVAGPLDELLAHTWTQRCFEHGTKPWPDWLRFWRERDQLPARADLAEAVRRWGPRRSLVRVVTDPDRLPAQLGVRRLPPVDVPGADRAELARRVAAVVGLRVPAPQRPDLMRTLRARMPRTPVPPVAVPAAERAWLEAGADRVARDLRRAGYPVVGDLADLAPRFTAVPGGTTGRLDEQVLDLAVTMLVDDGWRSGRPAGGAEAER